MPPPQIRSLNINQEVFLRSPRATEVCIYFFICTCFCVCDCFWFTRPWATTFRLRGLCMLGTCLSVAGPRKFASSASVRIFIVRTWWMRVRAQTGPRFIALIRRSLGSGVCTTVNSKWLSHFLTQRPKLGSNPWPLACQIGALTNWAIAPPNVKSNMSKHFFINLMA